MTGKRGPDVTERLNLPNNRGMKEVSRNPRSPRKRRIPRKPAPAQIERFEALRARVMGIPESR
ncbi:hypothetical protein AA14337_0328 [Acetobacter malorum DSM 14337]|uniref:Uncharacterized protein n=1 Tax=Acetobacter malorum DSM 14337 TaxID=1307910 RepID=A0ABQ0PMQ6_9PROT|nr:hypothetical protein [Acetobacter malorum]GBQ75790.1 hypothetical protein AA14337_0328 [Acetobacter malorum DSM 14337]